ncbi:MAG: phage holin family protein [Clostridia bacterium]|nr:phage holin family protein [Clostridia bacterium]MBR6742975.1 phage holin family protein [Clostridia bacterium]
MDFLNEYTELVILGICLCIGYILKNLLPSKKLDRFIPLIMGSMGVVLSIWINMDITPKILLSGLVSGLSSTGLYETFKQFLKKGE